MQIFVVTFCFAKQIQKLVKVQILVKSEHIRGAVSETELIRASISMPS